MEVRGRKYDVGSTIVLREPEPTKKQSRTIIISSSSLEDRRSISSYGDERYVTRPTVYSRNMMEQNLSVPEELHISSVTHTTIKVEESTNARIDCINGQDQSDFSNKEVSVTDIINKKFDVVTSEKGVSTKQRRKNKMDYVTRESIQQYFGKPIDEASKTLGVSRSTLKRVCRKLNIPSWPLPHRRKKYPHFSIHVVVLLLVRVKRWSCSSNRHGFSARWWICGKHDAFVSKSKVSIEAYSTSRIQNISAKTPGSSRISNSSAIPVKGEIICGAVYLSQLLKENDNSIEILNPIQKPPQARFDMYYESPKENVAKVMDLKMVMVKVTLKDDMIKFQFPLSSGLLELKNQVARRFRLENTRLHIKYRDEDDDLILIACDADLNTLIMPLSATSISDGSLTKKEDKSKPVSSQHGAKLKSLLNYRHDAFAYL